jgi:predicted permease
MTGEVRHALRRLRATPVVTLSAVACLAIGVWMTCIVTAVGRGFFRPNLHIPDADRIVQLDARGLFMLDGRNVMGGGRLSSPAVIDSLALSPLFEAVGQYTQGFGMSVDARQRLSTSLSSGMMRVLRVHPLLGRGFIPSDDTTKDVVMLSYQAWQALYGGDSAAIGKRLYFTRNPRAFTIVGVTRPEFMFPMNSQRPDFYLPMLWRSDRPRYPVAQMLGRLADGVSIDEARNVVRGIVVRNVRADREAVAAYWRAARPGAIQPSLPNGIVSAHLDRYYNEPVEPQAARLIILILACGFAVVAIAAANVTNLLLVRGASRRQELAVRMALGAARSRVIGELLVETAIVASAGIVLGFLTAAWQWSLLDPTFIGRHLFGEIDGFIALISIAAGFALTLAVGIWPGVRATSMRIEQVLRDARRAGIGASPLEGILGRMVAASTAATVSLLILAVLLTSSARDSANQLARPIQDVLAADVMLQDVSRTDQISVARDALSRVRALPGVASAALGTPPASSETREVFIGVPGMPVTRYGGIEIDPASDGYFRTLGIRFLHGREFSARETRDSTGVVILSRALSDALFPGRIAVGERLRFRRGDDSTFVDATVVGVAESVRGGATARQMYVPISNALSGRTTVLVRSNRAAHPDIDGALRGLDRLTPLSATRLDERPSEFNSPRRYLSNGFTLFAVVALILAAVGTYGVVSYSVLRRTHEIGVRMALGADSDRVTWMVIEQGLRTSLIGVIGGLLLAFAVTRLVGGFVEDVNMNYPIAIGGVIVFVALVAFVASGIPGYRAGRLNPVDALRAE